MLHVQSVTVRYGDTVALDEVDLCLQGNETVAVLGASGSGKTTLLRVIAGLVRPDSGVVTWNGRDLAHVAPHVRRFGLVFQDFALFPHLDVAGNVGFGLRMQELSSASVGQRVTESLSAVGLAGLGERRIDELSGGQAQRVALARTLAPKPQLLLLDEPLGSLDPALRGDLAADLAVTLADRPALIVTHDTEEAFALGDRVVVMDDGAITRRGTPEELWHDPQTLSVARLLEHTVVTGTRTGTTLSWGGATVDAPHEAQELAIRPDAFRVDPSGPLEARVLASTFRGPDRRVTLDVGGVRVTARVAAPGPRPNTVVRLSLNPDGLAPIV